MSGRSETPGLAKRLTEIALPNRSLHPCRPKALAYEGRGFCPKWLHVAVPRFHEVVQGFLIVERQRRAIARLAPPRHRLAHRDLLRFLDLRIWRMLFGNLQQR
jgi:hypothetical protein